jgi:phenylalanyl-tRNA synthetase beta chain
MKFSEQWLREWVNPSINTAELAHTLTMAGLEVEAVEPVAGDFDHTVVGQVVELTPHPDADKLNVCKVDVGQGEALQIVCGAPNVALNMKAPVAVVGATLPGNFKIKKAKLRGVESFGMLCSAKELQLSESAEGLMVLPADAPVGTDIREYLGLNDNAIELGLTPNRGDCLSVVGVAREVGVLTGQDVRSQPSPEIVTETDATFPVTIEATVDCPHYAGRVIQGVDARAETPLWMQERLRRSGLRSLGPVVDVTNYVLLELGQPLHAFDLAKLDSGLVVRHAKGGESIKLLDGQTIELEAGSLVIADHSAPQALAGIMGGDASAVTDETKNIFLESAYFNPLSIAGRARSYGLHTDSSHRFERGVDPELQKRALERATQLLLDIVGGKAGPVVEAQEEQFLPQRSAITLRKARLEKILGVAIAPERVSDILSRLGAQVETTAEGWVANPPSFRFDMEIEADLVEEVARIHGYDNLPSTRPAAAGVMLPSTERRVGLERVKQMLVDRGYQEAISYSFVSPEIQALLDPEASVVRVANPISEDMSVMRTTLWCGLINALSHNLNRQQSDVRLFESGLKYIQQGNEINQENVIAGVVCGNHLPEQWGDKSRPVDFFDVKGDVESLLEKLASLTDFGFIADKHPVLHPGQHARISWKDEPIGWIGCLHPAIEKKLGFAQKVFVFELRLSCFENATIPEFKPVSRFPAIRRDLALIVNEGISAKELEEMVWNNASDLLKDFQLFDVYQGKGIDSGRKSVAFGLTFQDQSRTLEDTEIEAALAPIVTALETSLGATLRD